MQNKLLKIVSMSIVLLLFISCILSPAVNIDRLGLDETRYPRYGFTTSEVLPVGFCDRQNVQNISTDYSYGVNPSSSLFINLYNYKHIDNIQYNNNFDLKNMKNVVIRQEIVEHAFIIDGHNTAAPSMIMNKIMINEGYDKIYSNSQVHIYQNNLISYQ